jgi:hypothetical protein
MTFYFFNKCPEEKLSKIERLAEEYKLEEDIQQEFARAWKGYPFGEPEKGMLRICYDLRVEEQPFVFQTDICVDHKNNYQVLEALKKFIDVLEPTRVENLKWKAYDMREFT